VDLQFIGIIDLSMLADEYGSVPEAYPAVGNLLDLSKKVILPSELTIGLLSYANTDRYAGFDE
jgi:hypothetical protein